MRALPRTRRLLASALALAMALPLVAQNGVAQEAAAPNPGAVVAVCGERMLREAQLEPVLLERFALNADGRDLAKVLLSSKLIEAIARDRKLTLKEKDVDRRFDELDREVRARGTSGGLLAELKQQDMSVEEFRAFLRISMLQEELTRLDKQMNRLLPVTAAIQEAWLANQFLEAGVEFPLPPWNDGLVAKTNRGIGVTLEEYSDTLRQRLPRVDVEETAWHLLLLQGIEERLQDVSHETLERSIDAEIERRRQRHLLEYPNLTFEQRLSANGRSVEALRSDPSVRIAALARLWVDRKYGDEGLREAYASERSYYDGRFGKAVRAHMLFLVASMHVNDLNPRTFADAERELARIVESVGNTDDFAAVARVHSEEPSTRGQNGLLGWITREDPRVPQVVRTALFRFVDSGGVVPPEGIATGPERFDTGVAMLWISEIRPAPEWDAMVENVHNVLRVRFLEGIAKREDVQLVR